MLPTRHRSYETKSCYLWNCQKDVRKLFPQEYQPVCLSINNLENLQVGMIPFLKRSWTFQNLLFPDFIGHELFWNEMHFSPVHQKYGKAARWDESRSNFELCSHFFSFNPSTFQMLSAASLWNELGMASECHDFHVSRPSWHTVGCLSPKKPTNMYTVLYSKRVNGAGKRRELSWL